jgi:hypothetical protein
MRSEHDGKVIGYQRDLRSPGVTSRKSDRRPVAFPQNRKPRESEDDASTMTDNDDKEARTEVQRRSIIAH